MTTHFTYEELTRSSYAIKNNLANIPNNQQIIRLKLGALKLEKIREKAGNIPIYVTSGYRSPLVNKGVGGVENSDHLKGYAFDIHAGNKLSVNELAKIIKEMYLSFDQLIIYNSFIHISFNPRYRNQVIYKN